MSKMREKRLEQARARYYRNREKHREWQRAYYRKNREKRLERNRAYAERNREKIREKDRAYRCKNREEIRERKRAAYARNAEKVKAKVRAYRERNPGKAPEQARAYLKRHPEKDREHKHRRRARKLENGVGKVDLKRLKLEAPGCAFHPDGGPDCRGKLTVDHIFPLAAGRVKGAKIIDAMPGGPHAQFNLTRSCLSSNSAHNNRFRPPVAFTGPVQESFVRLLVLMLDALVDDERPEVRRWARRVRWSPE